VGKGKERKRKSNCLQIKEKQIMGLSLYTLSLIKASSETESIILVKEGNT